MAHGEKHAARQTRTSGGNSQVSNRQELRISYKQKQWLTFVSGVRRHLDGSEKLSQIRVWAQFVEHKQMKMSELNALANRLHILTARYRNQNAVQCASNRTSGATSITRKQLTARIRISISSLPRSSLNEVVAFAEEIGVHTRHMNKNIRGSIVRAIERCVGIQASPDRNL